LEFRAISYIWKAITAEQMEIGPYCQRQNCSPLNVLFIEVQISLILLGVPPLWGLQLHYTASRGFVSDSWTFLLSPY